MLLLFVGIGVYVLLRLRRKARLQRATIGLRSADGGVDVELERFIAPGRVGDEEEESYSDETYRQSTSVAANRNASRRHESAQRDTEEIFDVGTESDEEDSPQQRS